MTGECAGPSPDSGPDSAAYELYAVGLIGYMLPQFLHL